MSKANSTLAGRSFGPANHAGDSRGFTLVEMLVVVSVVVLIAALTYPKMTLVWDRISVKGAVDEFVSMHQKTRSAAVRMARVGVLRIDTGADRFWVQVDTSLAGSGLMAAMGDTVELDDARVTVSSNRTVLCFDSRGLPTTLGTCQAPSGTILVFTRGSSADTVTISALGLIQ